jgi:hypothetical protein
MGNADAVQKGVISLQRMQVASCNPVLCEAPRKHCPLCMDQAMHDLPQPHAFCMFVSLLKRFHSAPTHRYSATRTLTTKMSQRKRVGGLHACGHGHAHGPSAALHTTHSRHAACMRKQSAVLATCEAKPPSKAPLGRSPASWAISFTITAPIHPPPHYHTHTTHPTPCAEDKRHGDPEHGMLTSGEKVRELGGGFGDGLGLGVQ